MKTTRYFEEQVLRKRPYLRREWCVRILAAPAVRETQADGRIRHWGFLTDADGSGLAGKALRVVTLADGETVHNAFFDRDFSEERR